MVVSFITNYKMEPSEYDEKNLINLQQQSYLEISVKPSFTSTEGISFGSDVGLRLLEPPTAPSRLVTPSGSVRGGIGMVFVSSSSAAATPLSLVGDGTGLTLPGGEEAPVSIGSTGVISGGSLTGKSLRSEMHDYSNDSYVDEVMKAQYETVIDK